jgi:hypothetical protein
MLSGSAMAEGTVRTKAAIRRGAAITAAAFLLFTASCGSLTGPEGGYPRTFAMGFTDFPHDLGAGAIDAVWDLIATDGDLAVVTFDEGVPWQAALVDTAYPPGFQAEVNDKLNRVPSGHVVYLAVTPINTSWSGLAGHAGGSHPDPDPWDDYEFNTQDVIDAYTAYCERMIELSSPDYFAYAIEVNRMAWHEAEWDAFVDLAASVYTTVKSNHPDLRIFVTLEADEYHSDPAFQAAAISGLLFYTDMIAVSGYPFTQPLSDPTLLRSDYYTALADLSFGKPFAITETAWPAEDIGDPAEPFYWIEADQTTQLAYLVRVLEDCDYLNAEFLCWFLARDYDFAWDDYYDDWASAPTLRIWRDTGLYNGYGDPRPALAEWHQTLVRPLSRRRP